MKKVYVLRAILVALAFRVMASSAEIIVDDNSTAGENAAISGSKIEQLCKLHLEIGRILQQIEKESDSMRDKTLLQVVEQRENMSQDELHRLWLAVKDSYKNRLDESAERKEWKEIVSSLITPKNILLAIGFCGLWRTSKPAFWTVYVIAWLSCPSKIS